MKYTLHIVHYIVIVIVIVIYQFNMCILAMLPVLVHISADSSDVFLDSYTRKDLVSAFLFGEHPLDFERYPYNKLLFKAVQKF